MTVKIPKIVLMERTRIPWAEWCQLKEDLWSNEQDRVKQAVLKVMSRNRTALVIEVGFRSMTGTWFVMCLWK